MKEWIHWAVEHFLKIDKVLNKIAADMGSWTYVLLFAIIFAETGLVVTPFLPGDSLLFAVGALCATENAAIQLFPTMILLLVAAILGDAVNYSIGKRLGAAVFTREDSKLLNKKHLLKAHEFYEKYGGKTIIIARFVPIVRTFAPFVAGIGKMTYWKFASYNVIGAVIWVVSLMLAGYYFGQLPWIKKNFGLVTVGIIVVSILPMVYELVKAKLEKKEQSPLLNPITTADAEAEEKA